MHSAGHSETLGTASAHLRGAVVAGSLRCWAGSARCVLPWPLGLLVSVPQRRWPCWTQALLLASPALDRTEQGQAHRYQGSGLRVSAWLCGWGVRRRYSLRIPQDKFENEKKNVSVNLSPKVGGDSAEHLEVPAGGAPAEGGPAWGGLAGAASQAEGPPRPRRRASLPAACDAVTGTLAQPPPRTGPLGGALAQAEGAALHAHGWGARRLCTPSRGLRGGRNRRRGALSGGEPS